MKRKGRLTALALSAALMLTCCAPAWAESRTLKGNEKAAAVSFFNDGVNALKTENPYAVVTYTNGVPEGGITNDNKLTSSVVDNRVEQYLTPLVEGLFNNTTNLSQSFVKALFNEKVPASTTMLLKKGAARNRSVPLYGETYVSALTAAEDYDLIAEQAAGAASPQQITLQFYDTTLSEAQKGSIGKVFSLPEGTIDPVLFGTRYADNSNGNNFLKDVKFQDFLVANATLTASFDASGRLTAYRSDIDYKFILSFYDMMNLLSAFGGVNIYASVITAINLIMANLDKDTVDAESVLRNRSLNIVYHCTVEVDKVNFNERQFGDADGDGSITSSDARLVLRHAVGLEDITNAADLIICDMNFDGEVNAADARLVLRTVVGLETAFSEVPAGKSIVIADLDKITAPEEKPVDDTQTTPEQQTDPRDARNEQINGLLTDFIQAVFEIIDNTKEIVDFSKEIKNIEEEEEFY